MSIKLASLPPAVTTATRTAEAARPSPAAPQTQPSAAPDTFEAKGTSQPPAVEPPATQAVAAKTVNEAITDIVLKLQEIRMKDMISQIR